MILTWRERCEVHPDHQNKIITSDMIEKRMQEEIDELREFYDREMKYRELETIDFV